MENRFLFKGKRVDNGEWIVGYYFCLRAYDKHFITDWTHETIDGKIVSKKEEVEIIAKTLSPCTGLKDDNKDLIFENDIVQCVEFDDEKILNDYSSEVFWDYLGYAVHESEMCDMPLGVFEGSNITKRPKTKIKLIGNIHDNPELIKK